MYLLTAREADAAALRAAANLAAAGVANGQRVAVAIAETPSGTSATHSLRADEIQAHTVSLVLGALRSGVIPVMINPALPPVERAHQLRDCKPALVIDSAVTLVRLVEHDASAPPPEMADLPLGRPVHYTSGTTGVSKGVWTGALPEDRAAALWRDEMDQWSFGPDDVSLVHGPLAHSGPLRFAMLCLLAGGDVLLPGRFDASAIAQALVDRRPTTAFVVPSHLQRLFTLPGGPPPSPYRLLAHAGTACPESLKRQLHAWAGVDRVWEFYGSTEGQFTACGGAEWETRPGTVGRARSGRRLIIESIGQAGDDGLWQSAGKRSGPAAGQAVGEAGQAAGSDIGQAIGQASGQPSDTGVIWCEPPPFARFEYFGDPDKTAAAWRATPTGSAFTVGDLGRLDPEGYLFLEGRRDDLIITGGVNVYPTQVEAVLLDHPGVLEVAVFGMDDERWGQCVCAGVVGVVSARALLEWSRPRLAPYQRPKQVFIVDELPRTASGKIKRGSVARDLGSARDG